MNFDSPVMSKINLLFMLIMLIYDMIWVLLYLTNAVMIILREIVHESSCNSPFKSSTTGFVHDDPHNDRYGSSKVCRQVWHAVARFNQENMQIRNL